MHFFNRLFNEKISGISIGLIIAAVFFTLLSRADAGNIADSSVIKKWIAEGALIVDVRTPEEFASGNYKGSINIPLADVENNIKRFGNKNQKIIVYCRSGNRSGQAKVILEKYGYKKVLNGGALTNIMQLN